MQGLRVIVDNDVAVLVPPLHHQVVTANLRVGRGEKELVDARHSLEAALRRIEARYPPTPAGLGVIVSWGTQYFRRYLPSLRGRSYPDYLPVDLGASRTAGTTVPAFEDVGRFPSDPSGLVLEQNEVCFVFQSDSLERITAGAQEIFRPLAGLFEITSIRKGFVGGGFEGSPSLPKTMATRAGVPAAYLIPERAELFLGFTSTQKSSLGPDRIANLETLPGFTDQWPSGYFRNGTTMHLSHLYEDLDNWYRSNDFTQRVWLATDASRAANNVFDGTLTLPEGRDDIQTEELVAQFAPDAESGLVGHSASIQPVNRLSGGRSRQLRHVAPGGDVDPATDRLQHSRQSVLLDVEAARRPVLTHAGSRSPFSLVRADERLLPQVAAGDGRPVRGRRHASARTAIAAPRPQRRHPGDASPELPRPAAAAPVVPCSPTCSS